MPYEPQYAPGTLTLADWAKRLDPDGSIAAIVELLNQTNEILDDAVWAEGNLPTGHRTTVRADIPKATWRKLNYGVMPQKSKSAQVTDACGMLETYAEVDKDLADLNGNSAEFRLSEDRPFIEGLNQQLAQSVFYADTAVNPERFLGLAPRYDVIGDPADKPVANSYMKQIIDGGGATTGSLTSIWLIVWGMNTVHMIFPKASTAGLLHQDLGEVTLFDNDGGRYQGYRTHYQWKPGLVVRDWRYVVRIANVDPLTPQVELNYKDLVQAYNTIPQLSMGRAALYCTRSVKTRLDIAAAEKGNAFLRIEQVFGKPQTSFWGIPIRQCDGILETEARVV